MSATKIALENCIEKLVTDQGYDPAGDMYPAIWELVTDGVIEPLDYSGHFWKRDGKIFGSKHSELLNFMTENIDTLDELRKQSMVARQARAARDNLIVELRLQGVTWPKIAEASGLTLNACERIAKRVNGGVPVVPEKRGKRVA